MEYYGGPYNIPDRCPLYLPLPYRYRGYRKLSAFCRADPAGIGRALPKGFEAAADVIEVFVRLWDGAVHQCLHRVASCLIGWRPVSWAPRGWA